MALPVLPVGHKHHPSFRICTHQDVNSCTKQHRSRHLYHKPADIHRARDLAPEYRRIQDECVTLVYLDTWLVYHVKRREQEHEDDDQSSDEYDALMISFHDASAPHVYDGLCFQDNAFLLQKDGSQDWIRTLAASTVMKGAQRQIEES